MASTLSRKLYRLLITNPSPKRDISRLSAAFCTNGTISTPGSDSDSDSDAELESSALDSTTPQTPPFDRALQDGLDIGIYKAILMGQVGQNPIQKKLKSGRTVTLLSIGTGGIRNNRRPMDNENPKEYANRCAVQWHRVSIYPERLGDLTVKNAVPGSILYLEGNLETKIFNDPITGLVRRVREIAIRRNGRIVFLGTGTGNDSQPQEVKGVGYY